MKIALIGDSLTEGRPGVSFITKLKEMFPNMTFVNLGKPGESVKSLHTRLVKTKSDTDYDLSFLWIGVNDVYSKLLRVQAQPVVENHEVFKDYYEKILDIVLASSKKAVTVSPVLVGENTDNASNQEIQELNALIQSITLNHENVSFLDIQSVFFSQLLKHNTSDFINTNVMRVMVDALFYKNPSRIDRLSEKRGLHLTLDGIHLNSTGAQLVAELYASEIQHLTNTSQD